MRNGLFARYDETRTLPLGGYLVLLATFVVSTVSLALLVVHFEGPLRAEDLPGWKDLLLLGVAVHASTHMVARDRVLAPLRSPFTQFEKVAGAGEVDERVAASGARKAIGELLTCPYCLGPWATLVLGSVLVASPLAGRLLCGGLAAVAVSNVLHQLYALLRERSS